MLGHQRYDYDDFLLRDFAAGGNALVAYRARLEGRAFLLPSISLGAVHVERDVEATTERLVAAGAWYYRFRTLPIRNALGMSFGDETHLRAALALPLAVATKAASGRLYPRELKDVSTCSVL